MNPQGKVMTVTKTEEEEGKEGLSWLLRGSWGFPCGSAGKESASNAGDLGSIRIDWFDLLAVQETLKSLLQYHSSKASILTHYQRNANQNHNEVPFHASQNGCDPKVYKQ